MKHAMPRTGGGGAAALAVLVVSALAVAPAALAEEPAAPPGQTILNPEPPGQIILSPTPPGAAPVTAEEAHGALNQLAPGAGAGTEACADDDGWQVVVVRGSERAETVRGRLIAVTPYGCREAP